MLAFSSLNWAPADQGAAFMPVNWINCRQTIKKWRAYDAVHVNILWASDLAGWLTERKCANSGLCKMDRKLFSHSLNEIINLGNGALQIQDRAEVDLNFRENKKNTLQTKTTVQCTRKEQKRESGAYLFPLPRVSFASLRVCVRAMKFITYTCANWIRIHWHRMRRSSNISQPLMPKPPTLARVRATILRPPPPPPPLRYKRGNCLCNPANNVRARVYLSHSFALSLSPAFGYGRCVLKVPFRALMALARPFRPSYFTLRTSFNSPFRPKPRLHRNGLWYSLCAAAAAAAIDFLYCAKCAKSCSGAARPILTFNRLGLWKFCFNFGSHQYSLHKSGAYC